MRVSIIAAVAANGVIGKDNDLAWHLPDDMAFFKRTTKGRTVIMGRRNYESIPHKFRPLPGRTNVVISRNPDYEAPGCLMAHSLTEAIEKAKQSGEHHAFIIGGGQVYQLALEAGVVYDMYLTEVKAEVEGDTYFPEFDLGQWRAELIEEHSTDERHPYPYTIKHYFFQKSTQFAGR